ncbi:hypothetical protein [Derxia gummosa]|uniref:Chain length determinant protein n=1 Tax=Derxia gummosa DSM 723 TaxID=1121388 RepID=A0A8B6X5H4_9BURK|nr:hypothetical protein [Derxia gummosa]
MLTTNLPAVFRARRRTLFVTSALVALLCAVALAVLPRKYVASAEILYDVKASDPIVGAMLSAQLLPSYLATQIDLISSERMAREVIRDLRLEAEPRAHDEWESSVDDGVPFESYYAGELLRYLDAKVGKQSNVITVSFKDRDPERAARIANAFVDTYFRLDLALKRSSAERYADWYDEQLDDLRRNVDLTQKKVIDFQRETGLISADEKSSNDLDYLNNLSSELADVQKERAAGQARLQTSVSADSATESFASSTIQALRADVARTSAELSAREGALGSAHPDVQAIRTRLEVLNAQLAKETGRLARSMVRSAEVAHEQDRVLRQTVDQQRERILELQEQRARLATLLRDAKSAQAAYDNALARKSQASLESKQSENTAKLFTHADAPYKPSSPKLSVLAILAVMLTALSGIAATLFHEWRDPRVRSIDDLVSFTELPVMRLDWRIEPNRRKPDHAR